MNAPKTINKYLTWLIGIGSLLFLIFIGTIIMWTYNRTPPFEMISYSVPTVKAGETTVVKAKVKRDIERDCRVLFSRSLYDANGVRYELTDGAQLMNSVALAAYNKNSPDQLSFSVTVPPFAAPGTGHVMVALDYMCNPVHQFFPIPLVLQMDIEIKP